MSMLTRNIKIRLTINTRENLLDKKGSYPYNIGVLATIAQLVEHLIRNERVVGSNPISGSSKHQGFRLIRKPYFLFLIKMRLILRLKNRIDHNGFTKSGT